MKTVAVVNHKGGVGKTSLAVSLAAAWAAAGERVALVDLDGQASASAWLGAADDGSDATLEAFASGGPLRLVGSTVDGLDVAAASPALARLDALLAGQPDAVTALRPALEAIGGAYAWAVIDTPGAFGLATLAALAAASAVVVPVEPSLLAVAQLGEVLATIERIRARLAPSLPPTIIAPVRVDGRTVLARDVLATLRQRFGAAVTVATVRESVRMREAPGARQPIGVYDAGGAAAADVAALALELSERLSA
jgi:chromosome partitioning protein